MYEFEQRTVYALSRVLFLCVFPGTRDNEWYKHKNDTRVGAWAILPAISTYITVFLKRHSAQIGKQHNPDSKVHGANMGPIWGRQDPGGPHVGPMNLAIREWSLHLVSNLLWWCNDRLHYRTRQLLHGHVKVISKSLDIDIVYDDIHDRPCNKSHFQLT